MLEEAGMGSYHCVQVRPQNVQLIVFCNEDEGLLFIWKFTFQRCVSFAVFINRLGKHQFESKLNGNYRHAYDLFQNLLII